MSGRVTGIGGLFFRCADPDALREWYAAELGLEADPGGGIWFEWTDLAGRPARTAIGPFPESTEYFVPGTQPFMVNYRVDDIDALLARLGEMDEQVIDPVLETDDGRFAWVIDPDGQKVELWEPSGSGDVAAARAGEATGIGGVFFKSADPAALEDWYRTRLGIEPDDAGYVVFSWRKADGANAYLSWAVFDAGTDYFDPSDFPLMINLRVRDLDAVRDRLETAGTVLVDPEIQEFEYGRFGWIVDPAGIRIELWEPRDAAFD